MLREELAGEVRSPAPRKLKQIDFQLDGRELRGLELNTPTTPTGTSVQKLTPEISLPLWATMPSIAFLLAPIRTAHPRSLSATTNLTVWLSVHVRTSATAQERPTKLVLKTGHSKLIKQIPAASTRNSARRAASPSLQPIFWTSRATLLKSPILPVAS